MATIETKYDINDDVWIRYTESHRRLDVVIKGKIDHIIARVGSGREEFPYDEETYYVRIHDKTLGKVELIATIDEIFDHEEDAKNNSEKQPYSSLCKRK